MELPEESLAAFKAAFTTIGYGECDHESIEPGYEKVAFFASVAGVPTHAARQLASGLWTSKLGQLERIEHELRDLEGDSYGRVAMVMKRPSTLAATER